VPALAGRIDASQKISWFDEVVRRQQAAGSAEQLYLPFSVAESDTTH
jgi:hypothetical protein